MDKPRYCRSRRRSSWAIWVTYAVLLGVAIPWYWPADDATLWFGLPAWVVVAVMASLLISVFTACLLHRPWPDETAGAEGET